MVLDSVIAAQFDARQEIATAEHLERWSITAELVSQILRSAAEPSPVMTETEAIALLKRRHHAQQTEWKSIVDQSRRALTEEADRRCAALAAEKDAIIADRDRRILQLGEVVTQKDAAIADLYSAIAASDDVMNQKLREQRKELQVLQEELRIESQRQAGHRERMRFETESARSDRDAVRALLESAQHRAVNFEKQTHHRHRGLIAEQEETHRRTLETQRDEGFEHLLVAFRAAGNLLERRERRASAEHAQVLQTVSTRLGIDHTAATDLSAILMAHAEKRATHDGHHRAELDKLRAAVIQLTEVCARFKQSATDLEAETEAKWTSFTSRTDSMATVVKKLSEQVQTGREARAKVRSRAMLLDDIVAEYDAETAELRRLLAEAEEEKRRYARENMHDAAALLTSQYNAAKSELERTKLERDALERRVAGLEATAKSDGGSIAALQTENQSLRQRLREEKIALDNRVGNMTMLLSTAQDSAKENEEVAARATQKLATIEAELDDATVERNSLRAKFDSLREQAHSAENRAKTLERERKIAIDKELEKRAELRAERAAKAEEERRLAEARAQMDDDDPEAQQHDARVASAAAAASLVDQNVALDLSADALIAHLETQMLGVKRERDRLRQQLGVAMAEASAAEERRAAVMQKYLDLLNAADSVPIREMALRQLEREVSIAAANVEARSKELEQAELDIKKAHIELTNRTSMLNRTAHVGGLGRMLRAEHSGTATPSAGRKGLIGFDTQSNASSTTTQALLADRATAPAKLTPLMHRPAQAMLPASTSHPQHPPNVPFTYPRSTKSDTSSTTSAASPR